MLIRDVGLNCNRKSLPSVWNTILVLQGELLGALQRVTAVHSITATWHSLQPAVLISSRSVTSVTAQLL